MTSSHFVAVAVHEASQPGSARREAARIAALEGMSENDVGRVSIVVTEAAKNLVKHGSGGEVLLRGWNGDGNAAVEMLALDKGKGMYDVSACMRDGYSTAGTPGTGMGAMERLSDAIEIYSQPGQGTVVYSRIASNKSPAQSKSPLMECGLVMVPYTGETRCGDGWSEHHTADHSVYLLVDGLGHGVGAAEAADETVAAFEKMASVNPIDILDEVHHVLRKTRGAAVSVASIDHHTRKVRFAGVGNVAGAIIGAGKTHNMVSHNGILGHAVSRIQDFTYDWPEGAVLTMYSDGISSHWNLAKYPGLQARSPIISAALIYRDHSRHRDDATVLVARERAARN